jgi:alkylation response protein AidB-like acyl-CoA dehydrogenase
MPNFFTENPDLQFQFENLDLREIVDMAEGGYKNADEFAHAPRDYEDARTNYRKVLEIIGDLAGNFIAPRAASVDEQGNRVEKGKIIYADGTRESLKQLGDADLMGMELPHKFGGLNFPKSIYMMAVEMVSRADASLMNIFGLQDIAETIHKFGTEEQRAEFIPHFASGEYTGAMALTEPDAGSDLQAVKVHAFQDENGEWRLRGVKRFITNGGSQVLLVLARSEAGTKDARGLSMFVCYGDETVTVRRIENKLGIHGSPTAELQFNDTPAQLVGKRKFGLIKYVIDLMNSARLGVSAQALGISQAAYEEALKYAREREQFNQPIYNIPVVSNMLIDLRVQLEANRSLFYATSKAVDLRNKLEDHIAELKAGGKSFSDENDRFKEASRIAALLTPLTKYTLTEASNKITYDALQIHGGAGYMKEFPIERLVRDARITNIYEGTSQLQIVAAIGGVMTDILGEHFNQMERKSFKGSLSRLAGYMKEIRSLFIESRKFVTDKNDPQFQDVAARELVEMYGFIYVGYLLLEEAQISSRKVFIANRYIVSALAQSRRNAEEIRSEQFSDLLHADEILI